MSERKTTPGRVTNDELRRLAAGDVDAAERRRLFDLLRTDEAAAQQYRVLVEAERALAGDDVDVPGDVELDGMLGGILDAAAPAAPRRSWRAVLLAVPAVAAAAAGVFVLYPRDDEFRVRGGPVLTATVVELFCVHGEQVAPLPADGACARGSSLVVRVPAAHARSSLQLTFTDAENRRHDGVVEGGGAGVVLDDGLGNVELVIDDTFSLGSGAIRVRVSDSGDAIERPVTIAARNK